MNMYSYKCCSAASAEGKRVESLASILKIVAESSRLKLLCILNKGEHCVCELMEHVNMSQSLVSHHLRDLKDAGLVTDEKQGLRVYYALTDKGSQITNILFQIQHKENQI
jgi:ArsR family transcriptional regulator, arsenate/arsenite/antimonite-responsive transcriptional repressor